MKLEGNAATIPGGSRTGIPLPTVPLSRPGADIASRVEAARSFTSPIVMHESAEFTREQLLRAGYAIEGEKPQRRRVPRETSPHLVARREAAVRLYGEGLLLRVIAEQLGVSQATVSNDLDASGIERNRPAGFRRVGA